MTRPGWHEGLHRGLHRGLRRLARSPAAETASILATLMAADVRWHGCHPFGTCVGGPAIDAAFWQTLKHAMPDLERRDDIFIGGHDGAEWVAATGHYFGTWVAPWLGIPATAGWARLRFGEFYRIEHGRIVEVFALFDIVDLMRQAGVSPWRPGRGVETLTPGPATGDGVRYGPPDATGSETSLRLVDAMLDNLFAPDRESAGMERFWSPDMMWYGPALIGATRGLDGFFRDHETPWIESFPDWHTIGHSPRFADGDYVGLLGWPSLQATQTGDLFGLAPTNRPVTINLMDFWRRDGDLLAENWVLIDLPSVFLQLGVDLLAGAG